MTDLHYFTAGCLVGIAAIVALVEHARHVTFWDEAVVVKICASGDMVYRLADGRYAVPRAGIVENFNTVCTELLP